MMQLFSLILVAALATPGFADDKSGKQCPGGYTNGNQMDIGRYWYECRDGQVVPKGCLADDGHRVEIDGTFDTKQYRMQCVLDKDDFLSLVFQACMLNGQEHDVSSQWDDGNAYFTCIKEGNNVRVITLGCYDQGRMMKMDDRVAKGDSIFQCKKSADGTPKINKVGCVFEGRKYSIGETYEASKFWYTCTDSGSKVVGCMFESHRLQDGDRYTKDDMMYTCRVNGDKTDFEPFGCLQREESGASIERRVGCFYVEGEYEYTCKAENKKLTKVPVKCVYKSPIGILKLGPGCMVLADSIAVGCVQEAGTLKTRTYSADQMGRVAGLHQC